MAEKLHSKVVEVKGFAVVYIFDNPHEERIGEVFTCGKHGHYNKARDARQRALNEFTGDMETKLVPCIVKIRVKQ